MKKLTTILLMMMVTLGSYAQNDAISKLFSQYYDDENFTKVSVSSKMFELFTNIEPGDEDEKAILEAISKLKGLKVLASDSIVNSRKMYDEVIKKISTNGYEELMAVKDAEEDMKFMIMETDGKITELVMVVGGKKHFVLLSLYGEIDLKNISKLSKSLKINGMEHLEHMNNKKENTDKQQS